jgi:hypothetical protein
MPSKDTIPFRITKNTKNELERIRKVISEEMGINEQDITWKQAEIIFRIKANSGKINIKQINDVLLGKVR